MSSLKSPNIANLPFKSKQVNLDFLNLVSMFVDFPVVFSAKCRPSLSQLC